MSTIDGARRADTINAEPRPRRRVAAPFRIASPPPPLARDGRVWESDLEANKSGRFDLIFAEKLGGVLGEGFCRGRTVHLSRQDGLGRLGNGLRYLGLSRSRGEADASRELLTGLEQRRLTAVRLQRVDARAGRGCADRNELLSHGLSGAQPLRQLDGLIRILCRGGHFVRERDTADRVRLAAPTGRIQPRRHLVRQVFDRRGTIRSPVVAPAPGSLSGDRQVPGREVLVLRRLPGLGVQQGIYRKELGL